MVVCCPCAICWRSGARCLWHMQTVTLLDDTNRLIMLMLLWCDKSCLLMLGLPLCMRLLFNRWTC
jgi:hypothetical protein